MIGQMAIAIALPGSRSWTFGDPYFVLNGSPFCRRAVARQLSILYNSQIWPKSVACKIVDLRSRMPSLYPGTCGFGDMRSRFLYIRDMLVNAHGNIDRNSSNSRNQGHVKRSEFLYRCLLLVEGFIIHEQFRDDPQGRKGPDF